MVIQLSLTLVLLGYLAYAQFQRSTSRIVSALTACAAVCGLVLVWNPEFSTLVANAVGVGRGADLLLYLLIAAAGSVSLYLHLKMELSNRMMTDLIRSIAVANPRHPS